jgi:hypothetical protein
MTRKSARHASADLIRDYVAGDATTAEEQVWALEAHLETCAACRQRVADAVSGHAPQVTELLNAVWAAVDVAAADHTPTPLRSRWARRMLTWASPAMVPWLAMTVLVVLMALGFDLAARAVNSALPSLVALLAPVTPLLGVAAAWAKGMDPMHELAAATPRAGLYLVLRRTVAVLLVVIPVLGLVGWATNASPAVWLLPCLAFTVGTLALGAQIGVARAALGLTAVWTVFVVAPSLLTRGLPLLLQPASLPGWGLAIAVAAVVLGVRSQAYARLTSQR